MSHNHYLGCRACGKTTEQQSESHGTGGPHSCFSRLDGGDEAVANALAIREIYNAGIFSMDHMSPLASWAPFIAEHAACNAFYELCGQSGEPWENVSCECPRRIMVKGAADPPCESCFGRRLVPCPRCAGAKVHGLEQAGDQHAPACEKCGRVEWKFGPVALAKIGGMVRCAPCLSSYTDGIRKGASS